MRSVIFQMHLCSRCLASKDRRRPKHPSLFVSPHKIFRLSTTKKKIQHGGHLLLLSPHGTSFRVVKRTRTNF